MSGIEVFEKIQRWGEDRNLIKGSSPDKQFLKLMEEVGELADALGKENIDEIEDAIGDIVVVLTLMARQKNMFIEDCIEMAYNEIKDRKGKMINGMFVKEETGGTLAEWVTADEGTIGNRYGFLTTREGNE